MAKTLCLMGYTLRSGAAQGADAAFESGSTRNEIWLPWRGFNGHSSPLLPSPAAFVLAAQHHPAWHACSRGARALHARNMHQVLGPNLDSPSSFILFWTPNIIPSGGTSQALRLAAAHSIPCYNLRDPSTKLPF